MARTQPLLGDRHGCNHFTCVSSLSRQPQKVGILSIPILYMMKLKHREFNDLPKGTSLVNGELGFEHWQ